MHDSKGRPTATPFRVPYRALFIIHGVILVVAALYFGQPVLLPVVLATLLTFLLRPLTVGLERRRVPRVAAVVLTVLAILCGIVAVGGIVTQQFGDLAVHLDDYRGHLRAKVRALKGVQAGAFENIKEVIGEVSEIIYDKPTKAASGKKSPAKEVDATPPKKTGHDAAADEPQRVTIVPSASSAAALAFVWEMLSTPVATAAVVFVLVVFMLLDFEELRNRILRIAGHTKLTLTTRTLDDVGRRISRYLAMNALVNGTFGVLIFLGLLAIGVDYAALWGFLSATLRFVPYVGPITAAALPLAMSVIQFAGWTHPLLVAGLFILLELVTNNVIEPLAYGKSAGVSTVALLVSAVFWTWLWGPIGLMLSVPMTVVLAVLGKHIPQFELLGVLLGDDPALEPYYSYYQRLLAGDVDEAVSLVEEQFQEGDKADVYDRLLIPAMALAERDHLQGELDDGDKTFIWDTTRELIEENATPASGDAVRRVLVAGCPAQDLADELALQMLSDVAPPHCEVASLSSTLLASEVLERLEARLPDAVCLSALGPGGASQVRYLCKRIRQKFPQLCIIAGRWGFVGDRERMSAGLAARGATHVVTSLKEAVDLIERIQPIRLSA